MTELRHQAAGGRIQRGDTISITRTFAKQEIEEFGRITRDYNPVHYEKRWWELKGFSGPIMHGLLVGSMLCEPGGQWACLATGMAFKFVKPVYVGDTVTLQVTIKELDEHMHARAEGVLTNQHGETVVTAELSGYFPDAPGRVLLNKIMEEGDPTNSLREGS
jgi:3-hydroxybutyryl-CoA dehydratase